MRQVVCVVMNFVKVTAVEQSAAGRLSVICRAVYSRALKNLGFLGFLKKPKKPQKSKF